MTVNTYWLTVVTIVKDDPRGLSETTASLLDQSADAMWSDRGIEWVIVDGSKDRDHAASSIGNTPGIETSVVWRPPRGIYQAMNDGLAASQGEYVYFLNAGDVLLPGALSAVRHSLSSHPRWAYGQVAFRDRRGNVTVPPPFDYSAERRALFARGRFPPHQGTIVRTDLLRSHGGFDTRYRIAADYRAMLLLSEQGDPVEIPDVLAEFREGGASTTGWLRASREFHRARCEVFDMDVFQRTGEMLRTVTGLLATTLHRGVVEPLRKQGA